MNFKPFLSLVILPFLLTSFASGEETPNVVDQLNTFIAAEKEAGRINMERDNWRTSLPKFPDASFAGGGHYRWMLETSEGDMVAELRYDVAPEHVRNIVYLSQLGYYDGLKFHRIIRGFMAQGGCPLGQGHGSPGYNVKLEVNRDALHDRPGTLSMARSQAPDSAGSQFFLTFAPRSHLDMGYSVFGYVVEGLETLTKLEAAANPRAPNGVPPLKEVTITRARVEWHENEPAQP